MYDRRNSWVRRNDFKLFKRTSLPLTGSIMELTRQLEASRAESENDKHMLEATIADLSTGWRSRYEYPSFHTGRLAVRETCIARLRLHRSVINSLMHHH